MTKDEGAEERTAREKFEGWLREMEAPAAEIGEVRDCKSWCGPLYFPVT